MFRYKKANLDPKPEKTNEKTTEKAPAAGAGVVSSTTKKPSLLKKNYYTQPGSDESLHNYNEQYGYNYNKFIYDDESDIFQDSKYNSPEKFQDTYLNNPTYHFKV